MDFPERSCLPCGATPRLRTLPAQEDFRPTKISFVNLCSDVAELRWVDEQGTEHDKGDLRPGSRMVFHTFEGHVTRAYRKRDGRLLMEHMAGRSRLGDEEALEVHTKQLDAQGPPVISEDTAEGPVRGLDFREVEHGEVQGHGYHNYGFVNTLPVVVQLFWREGEQERKIFELSPGETYWEHTYIGHEWVARTRDGLLTAELQVADAMLTPCSEDPTGGKGPSEEKKQFARRSADCGEGDTEHGRACNLLLSMTSAKR